MASGSETEGCGHRPYGCDCRAFGGRAGARAGCLNRKRRRHNRCRSGAAGGRPANLNNPEREDLDDFIKIINKLDAPYYLVLGNHDVAKSKKLSKEQYAEIVHANNLLWLRKKWNYTFKKKGYTFIVVDGAKEVIPGPVGYYRADTLEWLDKQLSKNHNRPVVIFQHYPVVDAPEFNGARLKTHKTYQPEKYFEVLNKHNNVLAVISGHFHINSETMQNGVYHISTPTLLRTPPVYKIIDIVSKDGLSPLVYTQLKEVDLQE